MADDTSQATRRTVLRGLVGAAVASGVADAAAAQADESSYTTSDLRIESWDGTELACTLFRPDEPGPHPSMLMTHGWGGDRSEAMGPELFASEGYVVLTYDSRGFGESGGEAGSDGPNEVKDAKRLITWLGEQPFVRTDRPVDGQPNPRVGMIGPSYAGGIQLNTAARDDRLDAIVPVIPWYDLKFSLEPNDVVKRGWGTLLYAVGVTGTRGFTSGDGSPNERDIRSGLDTNITQAFVEGVAANGFSENSDAFYRARSPGYKTDAIAASDTPTLTIGGWPDTLFIPNEGIWIHEDLRERGGGLPAGAVRLRARSGARDEPGERAAPAAVPGCARPRVLVHRGARPARRTQPPDGRPDEAGARRVVGARPGRGGPVPARRVDSAP